MDAASTPSGEPDRLTVVVRFGEPSVITVVGETDWDNLDSLRDAVREALAHGPQVVFDLGAVTFADSTLLNVLLEARTAAAELNGGVGVRATSGPVQRLFEITGAVRLFPVMTCDRLELP